MLCGDAADPCGRAGRARAWPEALAALARLLGGHTASLLVWTPAGIDDLLVAHNIDPRLLQDYREHYAALDPFNATQHGRPAGSINLTQDLIEDRVVHPDRVLCRFLAQGRHPLRDRRRAGAMRRWLVMAARASCRRPAGLRRRGGRAVQPALGATPPDACGSGGCRAAMRPSPAVVDGLQLAVILTDAAGPASSGPMPAARRCCAQGPVSRLVPAASPAGATTIRGSWRG